MKPAIRGRTRHRRSSRSDQVNARGRTTGNHRRRGRRQTQRLTPWRSTTFESRFPNSLFEAQLLIDDWRLEYNHYRPHQSLNYMTPAEYARRWRTDNQPELS